MPKTTSAPSKKYFIGVGRRKTAIAQVRIIPGHGKIVLNQQELDQLPENVLSPLVLTGQKEKFDISIVTRGGGFSSQQDAIKLGIARALVVFDETLKPTLRKAGLLTRDAREKERKKPGLKRARKAPQWAKR